MVSNSLCINYKMFKCNLDFEKYLIILDEDLRITLTKFRCGSHNLPISDRRYNGIMDYHICPLCARDVGDEFHYVLVCPAFDFYRSKYIDNPHNYQPNIISFQNLFTSTNKHTLEKLSRFIKVILYVSRI